MMSASQTHPYDHTNQPRNQMGGCRLTTTVVVLAGLALAAYGAFILSQRNPYTHSKGISFVSGGLSTALLISLVACCCCRDRQTQRRRIPSETAPVIASYRNCDMRYTPPDPPVVGAVKPTTSAVPAIHPGELPPPYSPHDSAPSAPPVDQMWS